MLPSRGLRPHLVAHLMSHHSLLARSGASKQFSSITRKAALSAPSSRSIPLNPANRHISSTSTRAVRYTPSSVRYASWYAPWTWSFTPHDAKSLTSVVPELVPDNTPVSQPVVTSATPELAPAGIDKPAVVDNSASAAASPKTVEELLGAEPASSAVDATSAVDISTPVSYWGHLKDMGLDYGWGPTAFFENIIELVHLNTSLGWAGTIAGSAVVLRVILFYFQRSGSDSMAKLAAMKPVLQPLMDQMESAKKAGNEEEVQRLKMQQQVIMKEVGVDMFRNLGTPVLQMVLGFGAFRCLRGMSTLPVPGMSTENLFWIHDLTVSDPTYLLPLATGGTMYVIMRMGGETGVGNEGTVSSMQKQLQIIMPMVMTFITTFQPAAIQLYFLVSAMLGGITAYSLRQPAVRRLLKIRPLPTPESHALYSKVVRGETKLSTLRGANTKVRYQAPTPINQPSASTPSSKTISTSASASSSHTINIKPGTVLPQHMRKPVVAKVHKDYADRDVDYDEGMPKGSNVGKKLDWVKRNYRPRYVWRSLVKVLTMEKRDASVIVEQQRKEKAKRKAERYELERKRRLQGR